MNPEATTFLENLLRPSQVDLFGPLDLFAAMTVAALLSFVLSFIYRTTHRGTSYSQSFLITMVIMAVATSVVMLIIGSNIARAFSLVGALSIIRFRTAVKDSRDTAFLFAAMIAGMGCGTGFYLASISMTLFLAVLLYALYMMDFGLKERLESIVRVTYKKTEGTLERIEEELDQSFKEVRLINRILDFGENEETNVYVVSPSDGSAAESERRLQAIEGAVMLSMDQSDQHAPF